MVAVNPLDLGATVKTPLWKLLGWASEAAWVSAGSPSAPPPVPSGVTAAGPKTEDPAALLGYNNAPALGKSLSAVVKSLVTPQNTLQAPPPPPPVPAQPTFSSTAAAAPASTAVAPAVAPESQPARLVAPSQGAGTQYTQGMTTLPPASTLPSTDLQGNTGLANATAAGLVAGTNQPYVPPPSLLQRGVNAVVNAPVASVVPVIGPALDVGASLIQGKNPLTNTSTVGNTGAAALQAYQTKVPVVSPFLQNTVKPLAGEAGSTAAKFAYQQTVPVGAQFLADKLSQVLGGPKPTETVGTIGKVGAESFVPVSAGDIAVTAAMLEGPLKALSANVRAGLYKALEDPAVAEGIVKGFVGGAKKSAQSDFEASLAKAAETMRAEGVSDDEIRAAQNLLREQMGMGAASAPKAATPKIDPRTRVELANDAKGGTANYSWSDGKLGEVDYNGHAAPKHNATITSTGGGNLTVQLDSGEKFTGSADNAFSWL